MLEKDYSAAVDDYNQAIINGVVKIASKIGISTIQSCRGSQIFETIGISSEVLDKYFTNTGSHIGGITRKEIQHDVDIRHTKAFDPFRRNRYDSVQKKQDKQEIS